MIDRLFSPTNPKVKVSSTKGATGHLLGAAGAVEAAFTVLAISQNAIPHTLNLETPDPLFSFQLVQGKPLHDTLDVGLSNSFGFGGTNVSLVFKKWKGS